MRMTVGIPPLSPIPEEDQTPDIFFAKPPTPWRRNGGLCALRKPLGKDLPYGVNEQECVGRTRNIAVWSPDQPGSWLRRDNHAPIFSKTPNAKIGHYGAYPTLDAVDGEVAAWTRETVPMNPNIPAPPPPRPYESNVPAIGSLFREW